MKRRQFLHRSAAALTGAFTLPVMLRASANQKTNPAKKLLLIFQRGGNDALNTLVPVGDASVYRAYQAGRPNLHLPQSALLSLQPSSFFGFHPALAPMTELINSGRVSFVNAVGYPDMNTSHFIGQSVWETAEPGNRHGAGWLNRYLQKTASGQVPHGVMIGTNQSQTMSGSYTVPVSENFGIFDWPIPEQGGAKSTAFRELLRQMAEQDGEGGHLAWNNNSKGLVTLFDAFRSRNADTYQPNNGANYPDSPFGNHLKHAVQMLRNEPSPLPVSTVMVNQSNYDHHSGQIGETVLEGAHADLLGELAQGIQAVTTDLGPDGMADVLIMVVSEFSRTVRENGSRGTDHGGGALTMLVGGPVTGRVINDGDAWPGLTDHKLPWVTDFRDIYWEVLERHLGANPAAIKAALPGYAPTPINALG